jgi:UDP-N-acetyl-D-glucosamine dehydrogenase
VLGVTYKRDVADVRESPALEIIGMLAEKGADVGYADPFVPQLAVGGLKLTASAVTPETLAASDCLVLVTDHRAFDYAGILRSARLVVDVRNALRGADRDRHKIVTL